MRAFVDVDDLICETQIKELLLPLRVKVPKLQVTADAIPNKLGEVWVLKQKYPWIFFGIHGWEHTFCECIAWSETQAIHFMKRSLNMGYDPCFKAPNWEFDEDVIKACKEVDIKLHAHETSEQGSLVIPKDVDYIHTHIMRNPSTDYILEHTKFTPDYLQVVDEFLTPDKM
jgi:hypothetical protein